MPHEPGDRLNRLGRASCVLCHGRAFVLESISHQQTFVGQLVRRGVRARIELFAPSRCADQEWDSLSRPTNDGE